MLKNHLARLREERAENDKGFTLIELLVVVVIIGILIAIAIPLYLNYENGAKNKSAQADVRNAVAAVEQCYTDNSSTWPTGFTGKTGSYAICSGNTVNISSGNTMDYSAPSQTQAYYTITVTNGDTSKAYTYNSSTGKIG